MGGEFQVLKLFAPPGGGWVPSHCLWTPPPGGFFWPLASPDCPPPPLHQPTCSPVRPGATAARGDGGRGPPRAWECIIWHGRPICRVVGEAIEPLPRRPVSLKISPQIQIQPTCTHTPPNGGGGGGLLSSPQPKSKGIAMNPKTHVGCTSGEGRHTPTCSPTPHRWWAFPDEPMARGGVVRPQTNGPVHFPHDGCLPLVRHRPFGPVPLGVSQ